MTHGPIPDLSRMLEIDPSSPNHKLFCFHRDGTEEITHVAIADPEGYGGFQWAAHIVPAPEKVE